MRKLIMLTGAVVCLTSAHAQTNDLIGQWQTPFNSLDDQAAFQITLDFEASGALHSKLEIELRHPLLPVPYVTIIEEVKTYEIAEEVEGTNGRALNTTLVQVFETCMSENWVSERNEEAYCGYTDWETGVAKEITGRECNDTIHRAGERRYDLYRVEGDEVTFAIKPWHDQAIGSTIDLRPPELGEPIGFRRIQP